MKRVYFVRHGETVSNTVNIVQGLDDPLSPTGEKQILRIGERARGIDFDALISSDAVRTQETAKAIAATTGKEIESTPLFREAKRPTEIIGFSWETAEYQNFIALENQHWGEPGWRHTDEENYEDLVERSRQGLAYLEAHEKDTLLVVTHGKFLRCMMAYITMGNGLTPALLKNFDQTFKTVNTGLTMCTHDGNRWLILTWNDHAHFAD